MTRQCAVCQSKFELPQEQLDFLKALAPTFGSKSVEVLPPTLCVMCRCQRRLAFKNERNLYRRQCGATSNEILSIYSPDKEFPVFSKEAYWGDQWSAYDFGISFDFKRPFFDQFKMLAGEFPRLALLTVSCENCDYNNNLYHCRNCYLVFGSAHCEDCCYTSASVKMRDCLDALWCNDCELCYEVFCCGNLYNCRYCDNCGDSNDLYFCSYCGNCKDCFGCYGLDRKQYYIFNEPYSKRAYTEFLQSHNLGSWKEVNQFKKQAADFFLTLPHKAVMMEFAENCTGDLIFESKNCQECYTVTLCQDCAYLFECGRNVNSYDLCFTYDSSGYAYEAIDCDAPFNLLFANRSANCSDSFYLIDCHNCKNCFGCIGMRNGQHCILNKRYSADDYNELVPRIIASMAKTGEWGEFFPIGLSCFGYNETEAQRYFPLPEDEVLALGGLWSDYEQPFPKAKNLLTSSELPDCIDDLSSDILNNSIECKASKKLFRVTKPEFEYYRKHKIPIPRKHPEVRNSDLLEFRNPAQLWERQCMCADGGHGHTGQCPKIVRTTFDPGRPEIIYCPECFRHFRV